MSKRFIVLLIIASILCGCNGAPAESLDKLDASDPSAFESIIPVITEETTDPIATEPTITEPTIPALAIDPGAHQLCFEDSEHNTTMDYYLHVPQNAVEGMPLIIFLHGDGEVGKIEALEINSFIQEVHNVYDQRFPFLVLSPCTRFKTWIDWQIPDTLMALIEDIIRSYNIDINNVIITGHSRGAVGVWYMINTYGEFFSCAVPVSCYSWTELRPEIITKVPIKSFCGTFEPFEYEYCL